jgi:hypothetical protein
MVCLDHIGQEFLGNPVVRERVDFEHASRLGGGCFEDCFARADTRIVD